MGPFPVFVWQQRCIVSFAFSLESSLRIDTMEADTLFTWWDRFLNTYVATDRVYETVSAKAQIKEKLQHTEAMVNKSQDNPPSS
jgi:hypothetical protein